MIRMRLRLRSKLLVGVLVYLLLLGAVGVMGLYAAEVSLVGMHSAVDHHVHEVSVVGEMASDLNVLQTTLLLHTLSDSPEELSNYEQQVAQLEVRMAALIVDLRQTQERFDDLADIDRIDTFSSAWDTFVRVENEQYLPLSRALSDEEAYQLARADGPLGRSYADARAALAALQVTLPSESVARLQVAEQDFVMNRNLLLATLLGAGVLGIVLGLSQATRLARAIEALSVGARRVAAGDLIHRVRVQTGDEIEELAGSFNTMTASLAQVTEHQREQFRALEDEMAERERVEAALRDSETRFRSVTESVNEGIVSVDAHGRILFWNRGARTIFGYDEEEVLGKPLTFLLPARYRAEYASGFGQLSRGPGGGETTGRTVELFGLRRAGAEVPLELSVSEWTNAEDFFYTATIRDVTERRAVERMKNEFVSMVSHELRTPMNGVIGMTDLLLRGELGSDEREYAEAVRHSGEALLAIIDDILDLSKIEAGRFELDPGSVRVSGVVGDVITLLAEPARRKALELACEVDPTVPAELGGDPNRLRQVLLNLVGNAIKFTHAGEVVVRVDTAGETPTAVTLRFTVRDTGIGIDPEARGRLFQVFSQADASMTRRYGGTGLGLVISKRLAELMGGEIGFESEPGHGSTFWFTAQFTRQARDRPSPAVPAPSDAPGAVAPSVAQRVLLVEDVPINQKVAAAILRGIGYAVDMASTGREALAALDRAADGAYVAVLMDCQMPEMDGFEATAEIRRREAVRQPIPIIAMTASAMRGDRERCLEAGMDDYLAKPLRVETVETVLRRSLTGRASSTPEPAPRMDQSDPAPVAEDVPTVDWAVVAELRRQLDRSGSGDDGVLADMVGEFRIEAAARLRMLRQANEQGDAHAMLRAAHSLRGPAGALGAREVERLAGQLERLGHTASTAGAGRAIDVLQDAVERACAALESVAVLEAG
jgi:PAS domain S-box-containing protein